MDQRIKEILNSYDKSSFTLPNLTKEKSWFELAINNILEAIENVLNSFGVNFGLDVSSDALEHVILIIGCVLFTFVIITLLFFLLRRFKLPQHLVASSSVNQPSSLIETELNNAINNQLWSQALRLRWRLFLLRLGKAQDLTLFEARVNFDVMPIYKSMFLHQADAQTYHHFSAILLNLEGLSVKE